MYGYIWRHLPGPLALRILLASLMISGVVVALFTWVFPAIAPLLDINNGAIRE